MRKFKINRNSEIEPSEEQLKRYKDFATVSHGYKKLTKRPKKPLYRDPKLFLILFLLGLIAFLVFLENEEEATTNETQVEESYE
ncbi:hypothetical protein SAMN05216474_2274 [Lishizhenia tianjinensis]|uniref:Uncharacterized protein n=1 Tax=Lishizhenia tianjinensis TaxID=477690 RepID=A0A1I7ANV0_9FLAO|nr:hypothetical protein [Lishizhenia tianjinensis]SFT76629.1 hypothetical protein SAMN05216474_2274 [Lishizhenia tianjinensis]